MIKYGLDTEKVYTNKQGLNFRIIEFVDSLKVVCKFTGSGNIKSFQARYLRDGFAKDDIPIKVYGAGIYDEEGHAGGKIYKTWLGMLERCYDYKYHKKKPTYKNCKLCDEWLFFSNFRKWMEKQDYKGKQLDKDIIKVGNKVYCPEYCVFICNDINTLLTNRVNDRGLFPLGVSITKVGRYSAKCNDHGKCKYLGTYDTPEQAHAAYVSYKSKLIREVAETQEPRVKAGLIRHAEALENSVEEQK